MSVNTSLVRTMIYPFSWLYGLGVGIRNVLFQWGILKEQEFSLPVICIGNLTIGGTGKTPHTEYLIRLLNNYKLAVLSRGYGRKTRGFIQANTNSTALEIGDEPFQIHQKFPKITVAVDEKRAEGIFLLQKEVNPDVILLDDAYQHRYVKAGLNILLTDYNRLITRDSLLPAGRLREPVSQKNRAHLIVVTKCPASNFPANNPQECAEIRKELRLKSNQKLFFSTIKYREPKAVYTTAEISWQSISNDTPVLIIAGIANPTPLLQEVQKHCHKVQLMEFRDHHGFTDADIRHIQQQTKNLGKDALILTTEKDAARLKGLSLPQELKDKLYQVPIEVEIHSDNNEHFNDCIKNFVENFKSVCKEQK